MVQCDIMFGNPCIRPFGSNLNNKYTRLIIVLSLKVDGNVVHYVKVYGNVYYKNCSSYIYMILRMWSEHNKIWGRGSGSEEFGQERYLKNKM